MKERTRMMRKRYFRTAEVVSTYKRTLYTSPQAFKKEAEEGESVEPSFSSQHLKARAFLGLFIEQAMVFMEKGQWFFLLFLTSQETGCREGVSQEHGEIMVCFSPFDPSLKSGSQVEGQALEVFGTFSLGSFEDLRLLNCLLFFKREALIWFREFIIPRKQYALIQQGQGSLLKGETCALWEGEELFVEESACQALERLDAQRF